MKKILQIKTSKRRIAAASSVATGSGGKSSRSNQRTLHPLFTCSTEQRDASTQRRLRTVLEEASSLPNCPRVRSEIRHKKRNINASLVPNLYLLAAGDVEHSFVVPGFEEYCAQDDHSIVSFAFIRIPFIAAIYSNWFWSTCLSVTLTESNAINMHRSTHRYCHHHIQ